MANKSNIQNNDKMKLREIRLNGALDISNDPTTIVNSEKINFSSIKNMRYTDTSIRSIRGMTRLNNPSISPNSVIKNAFQYNKDFPTKESHLLVSARNTLNANQKIYSSSTVIPAQGNINTLRWASTDNSDAAGIDMFMDAPNGMLSVCNGKDTLLWPGTEYPASLFHDFDPNGTYKYDWTEQITNSLTTEDNIATLHSAPKTLDADTKLLLHLDNNVIDSSPTTPHTVTNSGVTFSSAAKIFGYSAYFNSTSSYLSIPNNVDFDLSAGLWTIDFWLWREGPSASGIAKQTIYYHGTDANNYMHIFTIHNPGSTFCNYKMEIVKAGAVIVSADLGSDRYFMNNWGHFAFVEDGDTYKVFLNGILKNIVTSTSRPEVYTGQVFIGKPGAAEYGSPFGGYIDEFRISSTPRWSSNFTVPVSPYAASGSVTNLFIGSTLQLDGLKFHVHAPNTNVGALSVFYWDGTNWEPVTGMNNGTTTDNSPLAKTGWVTFNSTVGLTELKIIDGIPLYFYRVEITNLAAGVKLSQVSVSAPFQQIKDMWDGVDRKIGTFHVYRNNAYEDCSTALVDDEYNSTNEGTFAKIGGLNKETDYIVVGFTERMQGVEFNFIAGKSNKAMTNLRASYWNGNDWSPLVIDDQTSNEGNISFSKSGMVSWAPIDKNLEHRRIIAGRAIPVQIPTTVPVQFGYHSNAPSFGGVKSVVMYADGISDSITAASSKIALYYYKFSFSANLTGGNDAVQLYYVSGMPAQKEIQGYKFSINHLNRLWLCNNTNLEPNVAVYSSIDTSQVFNGEDSGKQYFGDNTGLLAGISLYHKYGSTISNTALFFKANAIYALEGSEIDSLRVRTLSEEIGIVSPRSLASAELVFEDGSSKRVVMWQSQKGIMWSDGAEIQEISTPIHGLFDPANREHYLGTEIHDSYGFIDVQNNEYHWGLHNPTNKVEYVFSIKHKKWFEICRTNFTRLNGGLSAIDENGYSYSLGYGKDGYVWRLENGPRFNDEPLSCSFKLGDIILGGGSLFSKTTTKSIKFIAKATEDDSTIVAKSYVDGELTGHDLLSIDTKKEGYRFYSDLKTYRSKSGIFHSFEFSTTLTYEYTEDTGGYSFEPLFIGVVYSEDKLDI